MQLYRTAANEKLPKLLEIQLEIQPNLLEKIGFGLQIAVPAMNFCDSPGRFYSGRADLFALPASAISIRRRLASERVGLSFCCMAHFSGRCCASSSKPRYNPGTSASPHYTRRSRCRSRALPPRQCHSRDRRAAWGSISTLTSVRKTFMECRGIDAALAWDRISGDRLMLQPACPTTPASRSAHLRLTILTSPT